MVIDTKYLFLRDNDDLYDITPRERKLLLILADNEVHYYNELLSYMNYKDRVGVLSLKNIIMTKLPVDIRVVNGIGLELKTEMLVM